MVKNRNQNSYRNPCQKTKDHMKEIYGDTSRKDICSQEADPLARPFLQMAYENLESSRELYKIKNYPDSIFLLQQSIEKATKSFGLFSGFLDEKAVKFIAHDLVCIFDIIHNHILNDIDQRNNRFDNNPQLYSFIENYRNDLYERMQELKEFKMDILNLQKIKNKKQFMKKEIDLYIYNLDEIKNVQSKLSTELNSYMNNIEKLLNYFSDINFENILSNLPSDSLINEEVLSKIKESLKNNQNDDEEKIKIIKDKMKEIFNYFFNSLYLEFYQSTLLLQLLYLAIPLSRHVTLSRYPEPEKNFHPIDFYTKDLPLIDSFETLADHVEQCIIFMNTLFHQFEAFETNGNLIGFEGD